MKKALKIYKWAWVVFVAAAAIAILARLVIPSHHQLASNPKNIEKIIGIDLPEIVSIESSDNLDRTSSRWDCYCHCYQLAEELSEEHKKQLDELCQREGSNFYKYKETDIYLYTDEGGIDELYEVSCVLTRDHVSMSYSVDESEGIFLILPFVLVLNIYLMWGFVLLVIAGVLKIMRIGR